MLQERATGEKENPPLSFNQAVYGGFKNFLPRHYIFKGFENSEEFNSYLQILLDWQNTGVAKSNGKGGKQQTQVEMDREV